MSFTAGLLISCAAPSRLEMDYGTSYKLQKFNQTANPEAEKNLKPVEGLDGQAAAAAMTKHHKEFEKQEKAPIVHLQHGHIRASDGQRRQVRP